MSPSSAVAPAGLCACGHALSSHNVRCSVAGCRCGRFRRESGDAFGIDVDDLWPRDEEHRYRLYARVGRRLDVLAASDSTAGIGLAISTIHDDQKQAGRRLADLGQIGVMDVLAGARGEWIVLPFNRSNAA